MFVVSTASTLWLKAQEPGYHTLQDQISRGKTQTQHSQHPYISNPVFVFSYDSSYLCFQAEDLLLIPAHSSLALGRKILGSICCIIKEIDLLQRKSLSAVLSSHLVVVRISVKMWDSKGKRQTGPCGALTGLQTGLSSCY